MNMCGRYFIDCDDGGDEELESVIDALQRKADIRTGEVFPANVAAVIANSRQMKPAPFAMKWGYAMGGSRLLINARSETAADKAVFADGMRQRRCLIPASHYFEWERQSGRKTKYAIKPVSVGAMFMAGVYRIEQGRAAFAILTREAAREIAFIHDRMPVILTGEALGDWLNPRYAAADVLKDAVTDVRFQAVEDRQESFLV